MSSSARDKVWGRQGGRWATPVPGATCQTCRAGTARYAARHDVTGELWRMCETCVGQARRLNAPITFEPLEEVVCTRP